MVGSSLDQREHIVRHRMRMAWIDQRQHLAAAERPRNTSEQATDAGQSFSIAQLLAIHGSKDGTAARAAKPDDEGMLP